MVFHWIISFSIGFKMKIKSILACVVAAPLLLSITLAIADTVSGTDGEALYLYEAAQSDLNLVSSYKQFIAPVLDKADWLRGYGTASPAQVENLDGTEYWVFAGCKPHDCPSKSYVMMYDQTQKKIVDGAIVKQHYEVHDIQYSLIDSIVASILV